MSHYLDVALSFPTIVFSFFLCLTTILWLLTILGVLGLETGEFDGDLDVDSDGILAAEIMGFLSRFGLNGVPITIVISLISILGWAITFPIQSYILSHITVSIIYYPLALLVFFLASIVSIYLTAKICKPLRNSLKEQEAVSKRHLIGRLATVRSLSVTESYGEATLNDGGAGLILRIRDDQNQNFKRGDKVILLEFLENSEAYRVISEDEFKGI